jgi:hypothetical protein
MSADPFMLTNIYATAPKARATHMTHPHTHTSRGVLSQALTDDLHARLQRAIACRGASACTASLRAEDP